MNALKNNKQVKALMAQFNDDTSDNPDPEKQAAIGDFVVCVLDIFDGPDDAISKTGGSGDDYQNNLQTFFHNLSIVAVLHTFTHGIPQCHAKLAKMWKNSENLNQHRCCKEERKQYEKISCLLQSSWMQSKY